MSSMFSKIFSSKQGVDTSTADQTTQQQKSTTQQTGDVTQQSKDTTNYMTGDKNTQPQNNKQPQDPLAAFAKIFDNVPNDGKKKAPSYKLSPDVLKQAADSLDFSDVIPKDFQERLSNNDPTVWSDIVNGLGRKAYSHALEHNSILTDRFVDQRSQYDRSGYGKEVTKHVAKQSLKSIAEKSPTTAKFMEGIQNELLEKNPDATPEWLEENTRKAIMSMAGIISPEDFVEHHKQNKKQAEVGDTDWDNYFSRGK
jgi:hypothetical protein